MQVGIIGAGIQAKNAHLPAFSCLDGVVVKGIADVNKTSADTLAKEFSVPDVYTDYHEMLNDPDIDLVSICTPHYLHKEMAEECAQSGKHILIEKPMATTVKDANEIIKAIEKNRVKLCVVQNYRLFSCVKEAKERIDSGRIGEIISIHGYSHVFMSFGSRSSPWLLKSASAGIIEDAGTHIIDIALYLNNFELIKSIYAVGGSFGGHLDLIMTSQITVEFKNNSSITLDISGLMGAKEIGGYVQGTGGLLNIDVRNDFLREIHQYSTLLEDILDTCGKLNKVKKGIISGAYFHGAKSNYIELINNFIDSIKYNKKSPISAEEGRMIALVVEGAVKSIKEERKIMVENGVLI